MGRYWFWLEVLGKIDSAELWREIERYDINLLDLDGIYIYGHLDLLSVAEVIGICCKYGTVKGDFYIK